MGEALRRARAEGAGSGALIGAGLPVRSDGRWRSVFDLLGREDCAFAAVAAVFPWVKGLSPKVLARVQADALYSGYLNRQEAEIRSFRRDEGVSLVGVDFSMIGGLSNEIREKLLRHSPASIGAASRAARDDPSWIGRCCCPCPSCCGLTFHVKHLHGFVISPSCLRRGIGGSTWCRVGIARSSSCGISRIAWSWYRFIPGEVDRAVDLGSGAGFPGLILAKHTGICFDLIEADQRKAAFLREAARLLGAPVTVHAARGGGYTASSGGVGYRARFGAAFEIAAACSRISCRVGYRTASEGAECGR